ncbi:hexose kinase [Ornithinibacillus sp. L9]|uniref:Tagatose-6-phosphate kinase n=1 Tax=Ornithinibacillus caprae TaxID=2678566 RepID=A0A6N8FD68_9BACI|nr:hexose kinase [Ornithinibacillus caprae]MUK87622.1 hexose kinase [Ornithinibacillus caprae]
MILTVTLNPSVDISYKLKEFNIDTVNRVSDISKTVGGKGLNVTRVLNQLHEDVAATGFIGGSLGAFIRNEITKKNIQDKFIKIDGETRNCIAIIHEGKQTEILESGPTISSEDSDALLYNFNTFIKKAEIVTISGSLPVGLPEEYYEKLLGIAMNNNTPVLLDTKGELLSKTLQGKSMPFLIKPNSDELGELLGKNISTLYEVVEAIDNPLFNKVPWVVVTLGSKGAIVKHQDNIYRVRIPKVDILNPVGSGDSVIAGFAAGLHRNLKEVELIKFGITMGVLNAMEEETGCINSDNIEWCRKEIMVEKVL